jgi:DNA polymerase
MGASNMEGVWPSSVMTNTLEYQPAPGDPRSAVEHIASKYAACGRCHLAARRTQVCVLKGNPYSAVACIGEGPGRDEDARGIPFVGVAGRLQDELFREFGIEPYSLAWMNLVGCRPCNDYWADNRAPSLPEMIACSDRTWMLLQAIRPRVVVCLGKEATSIFWDEPPDPWTWHRVAPPDAPEDWVMVGHARHPAWLSRVIGMPSNYKEYAAARTFYGLLREQIASLTKVSAWRLGLRYLSGFSDPVAAR